MDNNKKNKQIGQQIDIVWSIANSLRGAYKSDKYKNVIIPMVIIRRFECALEKTKDKVVKRYELDKNIAPRLLEEISGFNFFNTSKFNLTNLLNDPDNLKDNFKNYLDNFSKNIRTILEDLQFHNQINFMDKNNRLLGVVKKFSQLDLDPETVDNTKMGYIFEEIIRRFSENAEAGDHYTPREVIRLLTSLLLAEGSDDLMKEGKVATVLDMACGTGGMLSTANDYIMRMNPSAKVVLFGQEVNAESYAICLADMIIKGQDATHIAFQDTMKADSFEDTNMRYVIANPPFGTAWGGKDAADGVEKAVNMEAELGERGRFGAGRPATSDMQLLFMQHAIHKLRDKDGRAAIISNGSPLFSGGTTSGESQIRKMMLENDLIEAIIGLPSDLFYNTNIGIYAWIISKNKRIERKGKIQFIDATSFFKPLRKSLGKKRKEITEEQIAEITKIYMDFKDDEKSKIFDNDEFIYKEYSIYQPMQRNYALTDDRIERLRHSTVLDKIYDVIKIEELKLLDPIPAKDKKVLDSMLYAEKAYKQIFEILNTNKSEKIYLNKKEFSNFITPLFNDLVYIINDTEAKNNKKKKDIIDKIIHGLSEIDKNADIEKDKKGNVIIDKGTKDIEIVKANEKLENYLDREVYPYVPDAIVKFEENLSAKKPIVKTGAEFPFTRYFYKYIPLESSKDLMERFLNLESKLNYEIKGLCKDE